MSLGVRIKYLDGLTGKGDRIIKGHFREKKQTTKAANGRDSVYFGETLLWPISRPLDDRDTLVLDAYNHRRGKPDSLLGTVTVTLYSLIREPRLILRENLVDGSRRATSMILSFEIVYQSPDSRVGGMDEQGLVFPTTPMDYGLEEVEDRGSLSQMESGVDEDNMNQLLEIDRLMRDDIDEEVGEEADDILPAPEPRDPRLPVMLSPTIFKQEPFQLAVSVIEARRLYGTNINPMVTVTLGKVVQKTQTKYSTNQPFFDNYFLFDIQKAKHQFLSENIHIKVYNNRQHPVLKLLPGKVLGEFVTDIRTVYEFRDHTIFDKWAVLIDRKDPWAGPKGFVRLDMCVIEQGQQMVRPKRERRDEGENIEANLILPRYLHGRKQNTMVALVVQVYQAEDLPPMHTDLSNQIRQAFVGEDAANVDPFVEVSYAGFTCKTKIERYNSAPIWNQALVFNNYFPPLTHAIRINVRNGGVKKELIATHLIDLRSIMGLGTGGFLPTFGPSWINLYGTPRIYTYAQMLRPEDELNMGLGEGVAYRGRLLISIHAKEDETIERVGTAIEVATPVSETVAGKRNVFFLFAAIFDATVIDRKIGTKNKPIYFELSMGLFGNKLDGRRGGVEEFPVALAKESDKRERVDWNQSTVKPMLARTDDKQYYFIDYGPTKPCVYFVCYFEDHRSRMCNPNILEKLYEYVDWGMKRVRFLILRRQGRSARHYFRQFMRQFSRRISAVMQDVEGCRGTAMRTRLDLQYSRRICRDLKRISVEAIRMSTIRKRDMGVRMREMNAIQKRIAELIECPQHALPDLFISMIQDGQRVGFARIPARDIYYSVVDSERGKWNGQLATIYIRKQGREGVGEKGWKIQCQLQLYLWLGLMKDFPMYKSGIPGGVAPECFSGVKPPDELVYQSRSHFELRCYIFLARHLLASDKSGLSDPLARVLIKEHVLQTQPLIQTMSPMWDVMLHKQIIFFHDAASVKRTQQQVVVEIFDIDPGATIPNELEFLGRCFCEVQVSIDGDRYTPPRLQWWPIYRGQAPAGDLLAAFDLIQLDTKIPFEGVPSFSEIAEYTRDFDNKVILKSIPGMVLEDDEDLNRESTDEEEDMEFDEEETYFDVETIVSETGQSQVTKRSRGTVKLGLAPPQLVIYRRPEDYRIPDSIRPPLRRFRIEVLFWSMFGMVHQQMLPVRRPKVTVEIGGTKVESEIMQDLSKRRLFQHHLRVMDAYLPVDERYWPPLVLHCHDNRAFGTKVTVGSYTFPNVREYIESDSTTESEDEEDSMTDGGPSLGRRLNIGFGDIFDEEMTEEVGPSGASSSFPTAGVTVESSADEDVEFNLDDVNPKYAPIAMPESSRSELGPGDKIVGPGVPPDGVRIIQEEEKTAGGAQIVTQVGPTQEQLDNADWWTRFYATIDASETYKEEPYYSELTESEDSELSARLEEIAVPTQEEDVVPIVTVEEREDFWGHRKWWKGKGKKKKQRYRTALQKRQMELEKKRMKRIRKMKLRDRVAAKFGGDSKKRFYSEFHDVLLNALPEGEDWSWVEKIMVYPCALEELPDFGGFTVPFRNIPLYRGKQLENEISPEHRLSGFLKGNLVIYSIDDNAPMPKLESDLRLFKTLPTKSRIKLTVRVYIVRAIQLHPADRNGKADPYLILSLGKVVINDKDEYKPKELNPVFGKCYEFTAQLPMDSMLVIQVMDHDRVGSDELIGQTQIDIENRYHSPHRATCGLMDVYTAHGYTKWKDSQLPTEILERICKEKGIEPPVYNLLENKVTINGQELFADTEIRNESGGSYKSVEPLALQVLKRFYVVEAGTYFVPEHVETRPLVHPDKPGLAQGKLQMWIDMFEREVAVPPPAIDITPRQPAKYELRVIVWNTADVILNDTSLFSSERSSDIYVKGWIKGVGLDDQKTDVHYRSLSGEGNFNWRFIFPFDYIKAEDRIVYPVKGPFDLEPMMVKANCELTLQIWDADLLSADNFLGSISMKLTAIPRCAKTPKSCGLHQLEPDCPKFSLFKNKNVRGWWPCTDEIYEQVELQGKVECELSLLTAVDAENSPAGPAREEPAALPKPNRPDSSFQRILGPLNTIRYFIKYKLKWVLIKILIVFLILLILALFIYSFPGALVWRLVQG